MFLLVLRYTSSATKAYLWFATVTVRLQDAETAAKAAEDKAAQDEVDRQQRIKDSFAAQMPDEISQKVQAALQQEMVCHHICAL